MLFIWDGVSKNVALERDMPGNLRGNPKKAAKRFDACAFTHLHT